MYFGFFNKGTYDLKKDGNPKLVTNLMQRVKVRSNILDESVLYDKYDVPQGETPEMTAHKHFGSPYYHWVILMTNSITDRYYDWPLGDNDFENYLKDKYANPDGVHHYEVTQSSGKTTGEGPSDFDFCIEVNADHPGAYSVSNRTFEEREQDKKRQIKLLNPAYLPLLLEEFENLMID